MRPWISVAIAVAALICAAVVIPGKENGPVGRITISAPIEPWTIVVTSRVGGTVAEVYARPGERVSKDDLLMRLESKELSEQRRDVESAVRMVLSVRQSTRITARIPPGLRSVFVDRHPDVAGAEQRYVDALAAFDRTSTEDRAAAQAALDQSSLERLKVRQRVARVLDGLGTEAELASATSMFESRLRSLDQALVDLEVRAPADSFVDLLDANAGDHILPGRPAAVLSIPGEYFCEFPVSPSDAARLRAGAQSTGGVAGSGQEFRWRIDSITKRTIPVAFREDRQIPEETVIRARFTSAISLPPGSQGRLELP